MEAEQTLLHQQQDDAVSIQPAFGAHVDAGQQGHVAAYRGRGGRGRGGRGRGYRGRGRHQPHQSYGPPAAPTQFPQPGPRPTPAGGVPFPRPNGASGFSSAEGILGSVPPPVVCQICFSAGHSALQCPSHFSQPSAPALVAPTGETNDALWYPDSGASAHMTSSEGQNFGGGSASGTS
ncbi:unnamed protein product [Cuscuta epithymum]|uniref:Uncharacterized protein n=1 Tax=Cuscuta epithymum TaxID=186058 RepID=A0AAV0GHY0_9ASTE|nr:unnamed protein product [Cuscuta epithymum]